MTRGGEGDGGAGREEEEEETWRGTVAYVNSGNVTGSWRI